MGDLFNINLGISDAINSATASVYSAWNSINRSIWQFNTGFKRAVTIPAYGVIQRRTLWSTTIKPGMYAIRSMGKALGAEWYHGRAALALIGRGAEEHDLLPRNYGDRTKLDQQIYYRQLRDGRIAEINRLRTTFIEKQDSHGDYLYLTQDSQGTYEINNVKYSLIDSVLIMPTDTTRTLTAQEQERLKGYRNALFAQGQIEALLELNQKLASENIIDPAYDTNQTVENYGIGTSPLNGLAVASTGTAVLPGFVAAGFGAFGALSVAMPFMLPLALMSGSVAVFGGKNIKNAFWEGSIAKVGSIFVNQTKPSVENPQKNIRGLLGNMTFWAGVGAVIGVGLFIGGSIATFGILPVTLLAVAGVCALAGAGFGFSVGSVGITGTLKLIVSPVTGFFSGMYAAGYSGFTPTQRNADRDNLFKIVDGKITFENDLNPVARIFGVMGYYFAKAIVLAVRIFVDIWKGFFKGIAIGAQIGFRPQAGQAEALRIWETAKDSYAQYVPMAVMAIITMPFAFAARVIAETVVGVFVGGLYGLAAGFVGKWGNDSIQLSTDPTAKPKGMWKYFPWVWAAPDNIKVLMQKHELPYLATIATLTGVVTFPIGLLILRPALAAFNLVFSGALVGFFKSGIRSGYELAVRPSGQIIKTLAVTKEFNEGYTFGEPQNEAQLHPMFYGVETGVGRVIGKYTGMITTWTLFTAIGAAIVGPIAGAWHGLVLGFNPELGREQHNKLFYEKITKNGFVGAIATGYPVMAVFAFVGGALQPFYGAVRGAIDGFKAAIFRPKIVARVAAAAPEEISLEDFLKLSAEEQLAAEQPAPEPETEFTEFNVRINKMYKKGQWLAIPFYVASYGVAYLSLSVFRHTYDAVRGFGMGIWEAKYAPHWVEEADATRHARYQATVNRYIDENSPAAKWSYIVTARSLSSIIHVAKNFKQFLRWVLAKFGEFGRGISHGFDKGLAAGIGWNTFMVSVDENLNQVHETSRIDTGRILTGGQWFQLYYNSLGPAGRMGFVVGAIVGLPLGYFGSWALRPLAGFFHAAHDAYTWSPEQAANKKFFSFSEAYAMAVDDYNPVAAGTYVIGGFFGACTGLLFRQMRDVIYGVFNGVVGGAVAGFGNVDPDERHYNSWLKEIPQTIRDIHTKEYLRNYFDTNVAMTKWRPVEAGVRVSVGAVVAVVSRIARGVYDLYQGVSLGLQVGYGYGFRSEDIYDADTQQTYAEKLKANWQYLLSRDEVNTAPRYYTEAVGFGIGRAFSGFIGASVRVLRDLFIYGIPGGIVYGFMAGFRPDRADYLIRSEYEKSDNPLSENLFGFGVGEGKWRITNSNYTFLKNRLLRHVTQGNYFAAAGMSVAIVSWAAGRALGWMWDGLAGFGWGLGLGGEYGFTNPKDINFKEQTPHIFMEGDRLASERRLWSAHIGHAIGGFVGFVFVDFCRGIYNGITMGAKLGYDPTLENAKTAGVELVNDLVNLRWPALASAVLFGVPSLLVGFTYRLITGLYKGAWDGAITGLQLELEWNSTSIENITAPFSFVPFALMFAAGNIVVQAITGFFRGLGPGWKAGWSPLGESDLNLSLWQRLRDPKSNLSRLYNSSVNVLDYWVWDYHKSLEDQIVLPHIAKNPIMKHGWREYPARIGHFAGAAIMFSIAAPLSFAWEVIKKAWNLATLENLGFAATIMFIIPIRLVLRPIKQVYSLFSKPMRDFKNGYGFKVEWRRVLKVALAVGVAAAIIALCATPVGLPVAIVAGIAAYYVTRYAANKAMGPSRLKTDIKETQAVKEARPYQEQHKLLRDAEVNLKNGTWSVITEDFMDNGVKRSRAIVVTDSSAARSAVGEFLVGKHVGREAVKKAHRMLLAGKASVDGENLVKNVSPTYKWQGSVFGNTRVLGSGKLPVEVFIPDGKGAFMQVKFDNTYAKGLDGKPTELAGTKRANFTTVNELPQDGIKEPEGKPKSSLMSSLSSSKPRGGGGRGG